MEHLDSETPAEYRSSVEKTLSSDPELSRRLETFRATQSLIREADASMADEYRQVGERLSARLNRSLNALSVPSEGHRKASLLGKSLNFAPVSGNPKIFASIAAAAGFAFALVLTLGLNLGGRTPAAPMAAQLPARMDLVNYSEFTEVDPNIARMTSVANMENAAFAETGGEEGSINLQINVQDEEQMLRLFESVRSSDSPVKVITIQIPSENQFQILGESQLRLLEPRENQ